MARDVVAEIRRATRRTFRADEKLRKTGKVQELGLEISRELWQTESG